MKPFNVQKLPIEYNLDKELLTLLSEANLKYGEYKSYLKNLNFDSRYFLNSIILSESLKSTQIEGTQISQDDMYYLKYMAKNDENLEIQNLKKVIEVSEEHLKEEKNIDLKFVNSIHKILLDSVRGHEKEPGKIRNIQNWIGTKGCSIEEATYVPPAPEDVPMLLDNLFSYMNDTYVDPIFINLAISHSQFETIHAYRDGNGRLGRALIPIQLAKLTNDYISKINMIKRIYNKDMKKIKELNSNAVYRIMPAMMHQIVFTKKEIEEESGVSRNTISTLIEQLINIGMIETDNSHSKTVYKYKEIYNVFVGID